MERPYIERVRIRNYGCIKDCEIRLTPLHALIGPNDSGKSTVLGALATFGCIASPRPEDRTNRLGQRLLKRLRDPAFAKDAELAAATAELTWKLTVDGGKVQGSFLNNETETVLHRETVAFKGAVISAMSGTHHPTGALDHLRLAIGGVSSLRLDPDALRGPSQLIPEGDPLRLGDERGARLAGIYDAIQTRDIDAFMDLSKQVATLFSAVRGLSLRNFSPQEKTLGVRLLDGTFVDAESMSEGLLYYLAFAALPHFDPAPLVVIEEPENGLHPARIGEVMGLLREVSKGTQILIATHSPLVINEMKGEEITVLTRHPTAGTRAIRLSETPHHAERAKVYANGELWVSYCDGDQETALLEGTSRR